ncbi:MAG: ATP-binding domain-containing protein [Spirochaetaceae bacterium]|jgi:superfamily I DNA and RNA helicase|nr:ATP-binding domain-containing protein [Spirochaetaceae bacterium]
MSNSYFYTDIEHNAVFSKTIDFFESYAAKNHLQIYLINRPLGDNKYAYKQDKVCVVLIPKSKISFINLGESIDDYNDFYEDFIEDLGFISDKYDYKNVLGRPKEWKSRITLKIPEVTTYENILDLMRVDEPNDEKICDLVISLLTGSINDISRVQKNAPVTLLDKVKQKIILFDGDQTRFIYNQKKSKNIIIQGLSGTGKTELLLQRIKELYIVDDEARILFTCWNKVLSKSLRDRIPQFFNFMKVDQQIEWNSRLFCFRAWGSGAYKFSGAYSYICDFYNLQFYKYERGQSFENICRNAVDEIKTIKENPSSNFIFAFDYSFIDESQDFPQSFLELISLVTKATVYVAGDIFQDIFSHGNEINENPDFLLSKCYRTDPRTLMFAHALAMGLFEDRKLQWLEDEQWKACGYQYIKENGYYILQREPLRRFEDLDASGVESVKLFFNYQLNQNDTIQLILKQLEMIRNENVSVQPEDIAIIFVDKGSAIYDIGAHLSTSIETTYGWEVNRAYETKTVEQGKLLLSNSNNVKGLEFPFVICVTSQIVPYFSYRNTLYTMLTRSFIQSILIVTGTYEPNLADKLQEGIKQIQKNGYIKVKEPSDEEKEEIKIKLEAKESQKPLPEIMLEICKDRRIPMPSYHKLLKAYMQIYDSDEEIEYAKIAQWVELNFNMMEIA